MAKKFKLNPISGEMEIVDETSFLDLIDNAAPADTTTSATFVTLLSSAATEFTGAVVLFMLNMSAFLTVAIATEVELAIQIDGGADVVIGSHFINTLNNHRAFSFTLIQTPSKGNHTINLRWRRKQGTGTIHADANDLIQLKAISL